DESVLRPLVEQVVAKWRERFPAAEVPYCLSWEASRCGSGSADHNHMGYSGHFEDASSSQPKAGTIDWMQTAWWFLRSSLRSRWWHLEYDLGWGRRPGVRLCLGKHYINLRF